VQVFFDRPRFPLGEANPIWEVHGLNVGTTEAVIVAWAECARLIP
jgi:hypothetical protein